VIWFLTVNYDSASLVTYLFQVIQAKIGTDCQFVVINNSPPNLDLQQLQENSVLVIQAETNLGFGRACNLGLARIYAQDPQAIIWLINPDVDVSDSVLEPAIQFFQAHPHVSILGTVVYEPNGQVWFAGGRFTPQLRTVSIEHTVSAKLQQDYQLTDWVSGCSMLINCSNFSECPQFSPEYFLYYEDLDFCRRYAQQGHVVAMTDIISIVHTPSTITNRNLGQKFKHSTYSCLLMLEQHTNGWILSIRFCRLLFHALAIAPFQPQVAIGKFQGIGQYLKRVIVG
jgi:GT2 family glycosyltransferase